jgi:hypothetical protein
VWHDLSVVIGNFDVDSPRVGPDETYAVLVVDANAVLAYAVALEAFQAVSRWRR